MELQPYGAWSSWHVPSSLQVLSLERGLKKAHGHPGDPGACGVPVHRAEPAHALAVAVVRHGVVRQSVVRRSRRSCLNTSNKVLSFEFVIPMPPFISRGGGGQIGIGSICSWAAAGAGCCTRGCCAIQGQERQRRVLRQPGLSQRRNLSPPHPTEQPWR